MSAALAQTSDFANLHWVYLVAGAVLALSLVLSLGRLLRGPTLADRVIALDLIGFIAVGAIGVFSMAAGLPSLLAVAIVAALILFLGTAAFAIYLQRRSDT
jgi:multicomponent Na+:H+ antiporter subunit F